jgi:hypothetical protein
MSQTRGKKSRGMICDLIYNCWPESSYTKIKIIMLRAALLTRRWFSSVKVPLDAIKKLREETSAPMGECKKALEESECDHEKARQWLRQKGLTSADKRADKETR